MRFGLFTGSFEPLNSRGNIRKDRAAETSEVSHIKTLKSIQERWQYLNIRRVVSWHAKPSVLGADGSFCHTLWNRAWSQHLEKWCYIPASVVTCPKGTWVTGCWLGKFPSNQSNQVLGSRGCKVLQLRRGTTTLPWSASSLSPLPHSSSRSPLPLSSELERLEMHSCNTAGFAVPPRISEHSVGEKVRDRSRNTWLGERREARAGSLPDPTGA